PPSHATLERQIRNPAPHTPRTARHPSILLSAPTYRRARARGPRSPCRGSHERSRIRHGRDDVVPEPHQRRYRDVTWHPGGPGDHVAEVEPERGETPEALARDLDRPRDCAPVDELVADAGGV